MASKPKSKTRTPLWKGPYANGGDGITQSLTGRFLECRHRFWLRTVFGLKEEEGFSRPLEFGNMWHLCEELRLGNHSWEAGLKKYRLKLDKQYPNDLAEIFKWYNVCKTTFPIYLEYWNKHKDETDAKPVLEECSFAVPYRLPSGRTLLLRGKWDALRLLNLPKSRKQGIYIKEHKTKSEVDTDGILKTVGWNFQTMMYQIALRTAAASEAPPSPSIPRETLKQYYDAILRHPVCGVLYNVIRRPLADLRSIRQGKKESLSAFYDRLANVIREDSFHNGKPKASTYFHRWRVEITNEDIERFKQQTFHPIMEGLCDWWDSIQADPFNPWQTQRPKPLNGDVTCAAGFFDPYPNPHHWMSPWGVYNSLAGGFRGSFFEYLTTGREYNIAQCTNLFPEL